MKVGIQLFSLRNHMAENPIAAIQTVVKEGYRFLEAANHNVSSVYLLTHTPKSKNTPESKIIAVLHSGPPTRFYETHGRGIKQGNFGFVYVV
ncbi:MAG: hypothetical protein LBF87_05960 [Treponema sp.]|jgi:DNA-binding winged helix-turn-helix (wHTH) protein|nr:hypothetical protein [Treponema sp.]